MSEQKKVKVGLNVPEDLYAEYKKVLIDLKTNTTYELIAHMKEVVEQHKKEK